MKSKNFFFCSLSGVFLVVMLTGLICCDQQDGNEIPTDLKVQLSHYKINGS